jgi:hypothetical protein
MMSYQGGKGMRIEAQKLMDLIDHVTAVAATRMAKASEAIRALRPSEREWMTLEELNQVHEAEIQLVGLKERTKDIKKRVAAKRRARMKLLEQKESA